MANERTVYNTIQAVKHSKHSENYATYMRSFSNALKLKGDCKAGAMVTLYVSALWDLL